MSYLPRLGALVAASALAVTGVTLVAPPAQAASDPRPVTIGAQWLEGQLTNGLLHYPDTGFGAYDDHGLTIDAGFSLDAIGGHETAVAAIHSAIADAVGANAYITGEAFGDAGSTYSKAVAKTLVFAQTRGEDPTVFGGKNLVTRLEAQITAAGNSKGRTFDTSTFGDYANTIGQAFAARGLKQASSAKADDALAFLLEQQCPAGYFRLYFTADASAVDQSCAGGIDGGVSEPDTDVTALALMQLSSITGTVSSEVTTAIGAAESWLVNNQQADGSFGGGGVTAAPNSNSTGLAGWVLGDLGFSEEAEKAAVWVRSHQADEATGCTNGLTAQRGAIGYNADSVADGIQSGITAATLDEWRRTTSPTLPVLQYAPAATAALKTTGPAGYLKAGSTATYKITGVAAGDKVCVTASGYKRRVVAGTSGTFFVAIKLPAGTANRAVAARTGAGTAASTVSKVLGVKTLSVAAPVKAKRGTSVVVVVRGLASGEPVKVTFRGRTVRTGVATSTGVFRARFFVGRTLGPGTVRAYGKFADIRKGSDSLRIVR